jgi:heme/copper-type cytochrome/quinol oxidase subunit 3
VKILIRRRFESWWTGARGRLGKVYTRNKGFSSFVRGGWIQFLYIVGIVFMAAGIVNALIQPVSSNFIIFPGRSAQSISETFINAIALILGSAGIYVSYLSGRQTTKPRMVNFYLVLGLLLIATALYVGIYVYSSKG